MWELYDALIEGIPSNIKVEYSIAGVYRALIQAGNTGLASMVRNKSRPRISDWPLTGKPLKDVAALVKSWNFIEASIGMAAINAYYNHYEKLKNKQQIQLDIDAFERYRPLVKGKKVAVIGHFESAVTLYSDFCRLSIIEKEPRDGDYPDSASEYLLPEQDFVFITGMTFTNKTLPRLLELSKNARIILLGPSVPFAPVLFDFGVEALSGFCVTDGDSCLNAIQNGEIHIYDYGKKITWYRTHQL
jgi:uncharacterized protein (DUF4213/DUF364 family)